MDRYQGFRELAAASASRLSRTAFLLTGDAHRAEDLLRSALARTATHWDQVEQAADPEGYVRRVVYAVYLSRRWPVDEVGPAQGAVPSAESLDLEDPEVRRAELARALAILTPRQRAVVVLRFFEGSSEAETAHLLRCSAGTVDAETLEALARLRSVAPRLFLDEDESPENREPPAGEDPVSPHEVPPGDVPHNDVPRKRGALQ